ncbi:6209_t:CDS:2, partial [Cetraspora pellucida]
PMHGFILNAPTRNENFLSSPYSIFSAGEGRKWVELTVGEFKIWLAILIYAGIFKFPSIRDYWVTNNKFPEHKITNFMTILHFEQIKRHVQMISKSICIPSSNISIDEMITRFSGRSMHTVRIKNKPTSEGYKILSLCNSGYTYSFIFTLHIHNHPEVKQIANLNKVGNNVYHLVSQLPLNKSFNIYMDNFFSSINLFRHMRNNNFGTYGTVKKNSAHFPKILKIDKKLDWDTLSGVVVDDVFAVLWMDNGPVTMLTTIHEITGNENRVERIRHRPQESSTNATKVCAVFGTASKKALPIPCIIDDYNHHMNGVDKADQLHGYYAIQLPVEELTYQFENISVNLPKTQYVTSNFELFLLRLSPDGHLPE